LASSGFGFAGVFFQEAFVEVAEAFLLIGVPVEVTDGGDEAVEVAWLAEGSLGVGEDGFDAGIFGLAEFDEKFAVVLKEFDAFFRAEGFPTVFFWNSRFGLVSSAILRKRR